MISEGWPEHKSQLHHDLLQYFSYRDELSIENGIIFKGERILIPESLRNSMKKKLHAGHTGINSCVRRARTYVFWPGMATKIRQYVENYNTCASLQAKQSMQPLSLHDVPERPWGNYSS